MSKTKDRLAIAIADLETYKHLTSECLSIVTKIEYLETKIFGVPSGSPKKLPEGQGNDGSWKSALFDEIEELEERLKNNAYRIQRVNNFLSKLPSDELDIIRSRFIKSEIETQEKLAERYNFSRSGLIYKIENIILNYWI